VINKFIIHYEIIRVNYPTRIIRYGIIPGAVKVVPFTIQQDSVPGVGDRSASIICIPPMILASNPVSVSILKASRAYP
jgi:hypothetical protein